MKLPNRLCDLIPSISYCRGCHCFSKKLLCPNSAKLLAEPKCTISEAAKRTRAQILEGFEITERFIDRHQLYTYSERNRIGIMSATYRDLTKMRLHYPVWDITKSLDQTSNKLLLPGCECTT
jgi:hypothetical protein